MADGYGFGYITVWTCSTLFFSVNWEWSKNMLDIGVQLDVLIVYNEFLM